MGNTAASDAPFVAAQTTTTASRPKARTASVDLEAMKRFSLPSMTAEAAAANELLRNRSSSQLRVATWNVWFDQTCKDERIASLLREVLCAAPDVVCLQEVLPELEKALRECSELNEVYKISPFGIRHYGNLILVRRDLEVSFAELELTSMMDRSLLLAHIRRQQGLRSEDFTVATVHLESLNSEKVRRAQLQEAAAALKLTHHRSVLCGDFNFDATQTWGDWRLPEPARTAPQRLENNVLKDVLPDFVDVWPALHSDSGFTFDGLANPKCVQDPDERMRYDRLLAQCTLVPVSASLMGTQAIDQEGFMPSDHFGLLVDLSFAP